MFRRGAPLLAAVALVVPRPLAAQDPLASWNDTGPKKALLEFVDPFAP